LDCQDAVAVAEMQVQRQMLKLAATEEFMVVAAEVVVEHKDSLLELAEMAQMAL
jgi:hypothetical protein